MVDIELRGIIGVEITLAEIMGLVKLHEGKDINLIISTYGGFVDEAWKIYEYLKDVKNISITFDGICASAGTFVFLSIPKEKRKAIAGTMFAIHLPYNSYLFKDMNVEDLEIETEQLEIETKRIKKIYEEQLNMTMDEIDRLMSPDSFFTSTAAMGYEMISEIIEQKSVENENEANILFTFDKSSTGNRICAFLKKSINQKNNIDMSKKEKEALNVVKNFVKTFNKVFKTKDLVVQTDEGIDIEIVGDDVEVGAEVINTPDGTYTATIDDVKKTIVIEDGKIKSIENVETKNEVDTDLEKDVEELEEDVEELEEKLEELEKKVEELEKENVELMKLKNQLKEVETLRSKAQSFLKKQMTEGPKSFIEQRLEKRKININ